MGLRCLGLVLLVWLPGALHAQSEALRCDAPILNGGYFVPEQNTYPNGTTLTYTCDSGRKPAAEGWWATSTCQDGGWSPEPQCISENSCIPPSIPNGKPTAHSNLYVEGSTVHMTCDSGYDFNPLKDREAVCENGKWSLPVCEISHNSCGEPPTIPNAVIIHKYQEVFADGTQLQYQCKEGEQTHRIICSRGHWNLEGPRCPAVCYLDTTQYPKLKAAGVKVIKEGQSQTQECVTGQWSANEYSVVHCNDGELRLTKCCYWSTIEWGRCTQPMAI